MRILATEIEFLKVEVHKLNISISLAFLCFLVAKQNNILVLPPTLLQDAYQVL